MEKEFDPADCDFLNKAPLHVFIEQFLMRNESFLADIEKHRPKEVFMDASELRNVKNFFFEKYGILIRFPMIEGGQVGITINLPPPVFAVRPSDGNEVEDVYWKDLDEFGDDRSVAFTMVVSSFKFPSRTIREVFSGPFFGIPEHAESREDQEYFSNRLLMLIDLNTPIDQLRKTFDRVMKVNKKRVSSNFKPGQWKMYLMVYDLRLQRQTFPEIAGIMSMKFPTSRRELDDANNMRRYFEKCENLIQGGYRRFL